MKQIYIFIIILILSNSIWGQFNAGASGMILFPQGEFKESLKENGYGISVNGMYHFNESPFSLGVNAGWARYGSETRTETLLWPVQVEVTTANDIAFAQLFGRVEYNFYCLKPYAEVQFGFNYLNTNTEISDVDEYPFDNIAGDTQFDDFNIGYGLAVGALVEIYDNQNIKSPIDKIFLDFKMNYTIGGKAEYLKEGDLTRGTNGEILLNKSQSDIDYMTIQVGINFQFNAE